MLFRALGRGLHELENRLVWVARHKGFAIVLVGVISLAARALLLPVLPIPKPAIPVFDPQLRIPRALTVLRV